MKKNELIQALAEIKPILAEQYGVQTLALFGSYAKDSFTNASDVDILVQTVNKNYFILIEMEHYIADRLKKKVDLGYFSCLKTYIKNSIEKDLIYV